MDLLNFFPYAYRPYFTPTFPAALKAVVAVIVGILFAFYRIPALFLAPVLVALGTIVILKRHRLLKKFLMAGCFFALGFGRTWYVLEGRTTLFPLYHITVEAVAERCTRIDASSPWRYQTILTVKKVFHEGSWQEAPCTLSLYSTKKPPCRIDDTLHCAIERIPEPDGEFKWYLYKEGFDATAFQPIVHTKIIHRPTHSFKRWVDHQREKLYQRLSKKIPSSVFVLFSSLFFGNRASIKQHLEPCKPLFKNWGISHFLARSGIHLLIFLLLLSGILSLLPLPFFFKHAFTLCCVYLYSSLSWPTVSFNRALYTFAFCKLATLGSIPLHSMHTLALICLVFLLQSPLHLFFLDFQLTFLLTFCLIWIAQLRHQRRLTLPQKLAK